MKKNLCLLLVCALLLCGGCTPQTAPPDPAPGRTFTDDLGREVALPEELGQLAVSGSMAQFLLFALCPDRLAGIAYPWDAGAEEYLDEAYLGLPLLGQLYGGSGQLNLETLLGSGARMVIDIGQAREGTAQELDDLQRQTGIPFVHISASTFTMDQTFRRLGELLDMEEEAEGLARYCQKTYGQVFALGERGEKTPLLYITGAEGQHVIPKGSYHAEIIDLLGDNLAVVDAPSAKGTGNEVSMEQILLWDPEVILFSPESCYDGVEEDPRWSQVRAIREGRFYQVPSGPLNWMGFPPSVQRCTGMLWLGSLLYPEQADYDLYEEVADYYDLFYHTELSREQFDRLTAHSIGKLP